MPDRFTLEQDIMQCWGVVDDIDLVYKSTDWQDLDSVQNSLLSLHTLYKMKFEKLWDSFEECVKNGKI